ncbi:tetratricopeptide repeat protein [Parabacteroides sp. OttesenSCG-928-N08]|nr:tetratricopeptide repeat protein [Parabacteroides sp. OttesenSCG-928-N08]
MKKFFSALFSSEKREEENGGEKNDRKHFDILKYDGVRAQRMGQLPYAVKCFTEALKIEADYETMGFLVSAYMSMQEPDAALEVLEEMVALEPEHVNALLTRINIYFLIDRDEEVIPDCLRVLELDAENTTALYMLAKAKRSTGDPEGAIADLSRALELNEEYMEASLLRAEVLLSLKQGNEALSDVERVLEMMPDEEIAYLLRGRIHEQLQDWEAAAHDYQQVIALNPFNRDGWLMLGQLLIHQEKHDEAITHFDEAIEIEPAFAEAFAGRAAAKQKKGDHAGAEADRKRAEELNPDGEPFEGNQTNFDDMYKGGIF